MSKDITGEARGGMGVRRAGDAEIREYEALLEVSGFPGVPRLLSIAEDRTNLYAVTELLTGKNALGFIFGELSHTDLGDVKQLIGETILTLAFLHEHQLAHSDVKPDNIVRTSSGKSAENSDTESDSQNFRWKLVDFGSASVRWKCSTLVDTCLTGTIRRPLYISPPEILHRQFPP